MKDTKSQSNEKDVIIKGNATINGGLFVGNVWKTSIRNAVLLTAYVLKQIMLLAKTMIASTTHSSLKSIYTIMVLTYYE